MHEDAELARLSEMDESELVKDSNIYTDVITATA